MTDDHSFDWAPDDTLLAQYLAGEASPEGLECIELWKACDPENRERLALLQRAWQVASVPRPMGNVHAFVDRWRDAVAGEIWTGTAATRVSHGASASRSHIRDGLTPRVSARQTHMPWLPRVIAVACVVALYGTTSWIMTHHRASQSGIFHQAYHTHSAQIARVTLDDSTHVTLAPNSTLHAWPRGAAMRTVELEGEAYFDVAQHGGQPFVVQTGGVSTRVLGTSFDVRHYTGETHIAVMSGRVAVTAAANAAGRHTPTVVVLAAGTVAHITDSTTATATTEGLDRYTEWTHGTLVFRDAPVSEVIETLGRWYGYELRITDSALVTQHLTATFKDESPTEMLRTLQTLLDVRASFDSVVGIQDRKTPIIRFLPRTGTTSRAPTRRDAWHSSTRNSEMGR